MLIKEITNILKDREFISVATCDFQGQPNAAPKFFLKLEHNFVYLIDYIIGRTWENLKVNPRASLSIMDTNNLVGYQINGAVVLLESGVEYEKILQELLERKISLSSKRIMEGVNSGRRHTAYEMVLPEKFVVMKVQIEEIVEIGHQGRIRREKV